MTAPVCEDCGGQSFNPSNLPGFVSCRNCGKLTIGQPTVRTAAAAPNAVAAGLANLDELEDEPFELAVPDSTEPVEGWRTWAVKADLKPNEAPLLKSVIYRDAYWTPRQVMEGVCERSTGRANGVQRKGHEVPFETCMCGLYAAKTREHLLSLSYHSYDERSGLFQVIGPVAMWGKVIEGTQGWRSTFGYPKAIYVPYEAWHLAKPITAAYGVPVRLNNFLR
jgi:hypothetical protein